MSLGMSYDEFWHGDAGICEAYRIKADYENERADMIAWLSGMYFAHAIAACFGGKEAGGYPDKPYGVFSASRQETAAREEKRASQGEPTALTALKEFAAAHNAALAAKRSDAQSPS